MCSSVNLDSPVLQMSVDAWHSFVPAQSLMTNSNCWYITNLVYPLSPPTIEDQLTSWVNLQHIEKKFSKENASQIIQSAFKDGQPAGEFNSELKRGSPLQFFCMPNVYLAGFPKCGTTYLYNLITAHSNVKSPASKEGQFWRGFVSNSSAELIYLRLQVLHYIFHFKPAAHEILLRPSNSFTIDASASTIFESAKWFDDYEKDSCVIPTLLSRLLPNTKFIVVMRHPVDRLWSDYWFFCSMKWPHRGEENGVVPPRLSSTPAEIFHNHTLNVIGNFQDCVGKGESELQCLSLARGKACESGRISLSLYYLHLVRWLSVFARNQFLFLKMEDFSTDMYSVMKRVWSFLELSPMKPTQFRMAVQQLQLLQNMNENKWIKSDEYKHDFKMWSETRSKLNSFFRPFNHRLAHLLHDDRFLWDSS